ncbi:MAG: hypothetical protein KAT00_13710, partial [Planctomycetes bacterium]|nr:hypothetical protein [Planctomycetota bacterium]
PIDYFVFNEHLSQSQAGVAQLPEAITLFSQYFGGYPFQQEKYGMTELGFYGAIENQTNTIQDSLVTVSIHQIQSQSGWRAVFEMPIQLQFFFDDGSDSLITIWNDSLYQQYDFHFSHTVINLSLDPDHWILRVSFDATLNGIENNPDLPVRYSISPNFPNPFNPTTTIPFTLAGRAHVILSIYTADGKLVKTLVNV